MNALFVGAVLAALIASPALGQSYDPDLGTGNIVPYAAYQSRTVDPGVGPNVGTQSGSPYTAYGAVTPFGSPGVAGSGAKQIRAGRAAAVQECSVSAQAYAETTWGSMKGHQYRSCMALHGHAE
jgi:hypothetical protein